MISPAERLKSASEYYFSRKLQEIAAMRAQGANVINLGIGSPDLAPTKEVLEATNTSLQNPKNHGYASYRSTPELRKAIAEWYKKTFQLDLNSETEVLPLLGSKEGILYVSMAFLNPGDSVLVPNPGYPAYSSVANLLGANVVYYDLKENSNEALSWLPDFDALEKLDLSKTKIMWVNYPHMPTGTEGSDELFKKLIDFGRRKNILICNDNPYGLVLNTQSPRSLLKFDPHFDFSMELNSLSKSFNMAGWRVGMILGSQKHIDYVLQVKSNVDSGMFLAVQAGATKALALDESWHHERNEIYKARREAAWKIFDYLGFEYSKKQVGLFVWAKAPQSVSSVEAFVQNILINAHVFLTPGFIFGSNGQNYARISLCAPVETFNEALSRIQKNIPSQQGAQS